MNRSESYRTLAHPVLLRMSRRDAFEWVARHTAASRERCADDICDPVADSADEPKYDRSLHFDCKGSHTIDHLLPDGNCN